MRLFLPLLLLLRGFLAAEHTDDDETLSELPVIHTAFVQTGDELHYFSESSAHEALLFPNGNLRGSSRTWDSLDDDGPLIFDPPILEFGEHAVGLPILRRIRVRSVRLEPFRIISIMSTTLNFHTSFLDKELNSQNQETWVDVVFLAREEGRVTAQLMIHLFEGTILYRLFASAVYNPYRLRPFIGTRIPWNGTITRPLTVYNPYERPLKVVEIYCSGDMVHLDLTEISEKHNALAMLSAEDVEIQPFETRQIGTMLLTGPEEANTTVFTRIVVEVQKDPPERHEYFTTFPLQITSKPSIFPSVEYLDFGYIRYGERSKPQNFSIYTTLPHAIDFEQLYIDKGDGNLAYMEYITTPPIRVPPTLRYDAPLPTTLVKVWFESSRVHMEGKGPLLKTPLGRIIAISRGGNYNTTIPFMATVYQGELTAFENDLYFHNLLTPPYQRGVRITNHLPFGIAIINVTLANELSPFITAKLFEDITSIAQKRSRAVFLLKYNRKVPDNFRSHIVLHTNVTDFTVPLVFFPGKIDITLDSENQEAFDYGLLERNDSRTIRFHVKNPNPAGIWLRNLRAPLTDSTRLYRIAIKKNNDSRLHYRNKLINSGTDFLLEPDSTVVFDLVLRLLPNNPDFAPGDKPIFYLDTDYESRQFPLMYKLTTGDLLSIPTFLDFGKTHPGRLAYRPLQIYNAFDDDMEVTRLSALENDSRIYFDGIDEKFPIMIKSGRISELGRIIFHPPLECPHMECYLGMPLNTADGQWFVHGLNLPNNLAEIDNYLYRRVRARYDKIVKNNRHIVNSTVVIDTSGAKNIRVPVQAEYVWPRLLTRNSVHFPLTALGNFTILNLTLYNPASVPVVVQVIPLVIYPDAESLVNLFRDTFLTPLTHNVEMNETLMFSLRDTELFTLKPDSPVPQLREELEAALKMTVPRFTLSMLLKPHMKVRIRLGFLPSDYQLRSTLLLIRNNLTVLEPVAVYGRGARIGMQVGGIESRVREPLMFEIRHDHLTDCSNPKRLMHQLTSTLTVRRPFVVHNNGEVPFSIVNMSISGVPCNNRGFRILNCTPFRLLPNETYELHVAFTPDFLAHVNEADLQFYMHMNGSAWVYHIAATVPIDMMDKCHQALPRPPFENLMYYSCATVLAFTFICVVACAYLEGDRAVTCAIKETYSNMRPVFDLNNPTPKIKAASPRIDTVSRPSTVQANETDGAVAKAFYAAANAVISVVHRLWSLTLLVRPAENAPKPVQPAKKKTSVQVRWREQRVRKREAELKSQEQKQQHTQPQSAGKKVQTVSPLQSEPREVQKLDAKLSVSPKPSQPTSKKAKKEAAKAAKEEKRLLNNNSSSIYTSENTLKPRRQTSRHSEASQSSNSTRRSSIPVSSANETAVVTVQPRELSPVKANITENGISHIANMALNGSAVSYRPESPIAAPRATSPSIQSETSEIPEWNDETFDVFGGNLEQQFMDMSKASMALFDKDQEDSESSVHPATSAPTSDIDNENKKGQRKRTRRKVRNGRKNTTQDSRQSNTSSTEPVQKSGNSQAAEPSTPFMKDLTQPSELCEAGSSAMWPPSPQISFNDLMAQSFTSFRLPTRNIDWAPPIINTEFGPFPPFTAQAPFSAANFAPQSALPSLPSLPNPVPTTISSMYPHDTTVFPRATSSTLNLDLGCSLFSENSVWNNDTTIDPEKAWAAFTKTLEEDTKKPDS